MKKIISLFIATLVIFSATIFASAKSEAVLGDVNNDGKISIADSMMVFHSLSGRRAPLNGNELKTADIDMSGVVTIEDVMYLFQYLSGRIAKLPETKKRKVYLSPSNQTRNLYSYGGTNEAVQMQLVADVVNTILLQNGVEVIVANPYKTLAARADEAKLWGAEAYVAIHSNAGGGQGTFGIGNIYKPGYFELATAVYNEVANATPSPDIGVKNEAELIRLYTQAEIDSTPPNELVYWQGNVYRIDRPNTYMEIWMPQMPATIIEVEFHDNVTTAKWITENIYTLGESISNGILKYLKESE